MKYSIYIVIILIVLGGGWFLFGSKKSATTDMQAADDQMMGIATPSMTTDGSDASSTDNTMGASTSDAAMMQNVREFTVDGTNYSFTPNTFSVKKGDTVRVTFKNDGGMHDWVLDEFNAKTPRINTGETAVVTFVADKVGTFEYYCSVGNHRAMGMKGTLTVTE